MSFSKWKASALGDIANITMGQSPKGEFCNNDGEGVPLLNGPTEFGNHHPFPSQFTIDVKKWARKGDLLFCVRGSTTGRMNWADQDYAIGRGIAAISPKYSNADRFIRAIIEMKLPELLKMATGSTFPNVTRNMLTDMSVEIPSDNEIIEINNLLKSLDEKIETNNQINKKLEEMAQAIFKQWFVDFEFPNEDDKPYKSSGGEMVESELGMIPKGWKVKKIEDVTNVVSKGTTPTKKDMDSAIDESAIKFIKVKDIDDEGNISMNTLEKIPSSIHCSKLKRSILKEWDILFSIAGTIGRVATVDSRLDNSNTNQAIAFIRLNEVQKMFVFILHLLKSDNIQNEVQAHVVQAVQANASLGTIKNLKFVYPDIKNLTNFNSIVLPIFNKQTNLRIENEHLINIRDTLLPKLMSGEIRVPVE